MMRATRRSRKVPEAVSIAVAAARSQDSVLLPTSVTTVYTLSAIVRSLPAGGSSPVLRDGCAAPRCLGLLYAPGSCRRRHGAGARVALRLPGNVQSRKPSSLLQNAAWHDSCTAVRMFGLHAAAETARSGRFPAPVTYCLPVRDVARSLLGLHRLFPGLFQQAEPCMP